MDATYAGRRARLDAQPSRGRAEGTGPSARRTEQPPGGANRRGAAPGRSTTWRAMSSLVRHPRGSGIREARRRFSGAGVTCFNGTPARRVRRRHSSTRPCRGRPPSAHRSGSRDPRTRAERSSPGDGRSAARVWPRPLIGHDPRRIEIPTACLYPGHELVPALTATRHSAAYACPPRSAGYRWPDGNWVVAPGASASEPGLVVSERSQLGVPRQRATPRSHAHSSASTGIANVRPHPAVMRRPPRCRRRART